MDNGKHLENTYIIFASDNGFHLGKYDQFLLSVHDRCVYFLIEYKRSHDVEVETKVGCDLKM